MSGPHTRRVVVSAVAAALGLGVAFPGAASGASDSLTVVSAGGCKVRIQTVVLNVPRVPPGSTVLGVREVFLSLRVSRRHGGWEYRPDEPLGSLDAARTATLWAPGDVPSTVRLTVSWLYTTSQDSGIISTTPSRTVTAAIRPHACTSWLVRQQGVLASGVGWRTSRDGRTRSYGVRVRCAPAFRIVTLRDQVTRRLLATGRCNRTIRLTRPAAEVTHPTTAASPFPLSFLLQAAGSRSLSARHTDVLRCGSILPLKVLRPPRGRMHLLGC